MNSNNRSQQSNMSISIGISGSPKIVDSEPTSPFHQRKAFNVFPIPDTFNFSKQLNSNIYNSQNSENRIVQSMQNGRISPMNSPYPASSFYKPMSYLSQSIYQPQLQSQSPKQYENVLSPTFQPSNKLTIVEKKEEPVVVKKRRSRGRPRKPLPPPPISTVTTTTNNNNHNSNNSNNNNNNSNNNNRVNEIISKFGLLSSTATSPIQTEAASLSPSPVATPIITQPKPKPKSKPKPRSSRSRKKSSTKKATTNNNNNSNDDDSNVKSRIIYPDFDISSLFNDEDYDNFQFMTFSLKDKKIKNYKNVKMLKESIVFPDDEIMSLKDVLLPSEVISDIKFPKRKLEFVLISDSDSENENEEKRESKDGDDTDKQINKKRKVEKRDIKVKIEKEVIINNIRNEVVVDNSDIRDFQRNNTSEKENLVEKESVTAFYTDYERFLEDCKNGKLMSV